MTADTSSVLVGDTITHGIPEAKYHCDDATSVYTGSIGECVTQPLLYSHTQDTLTHFRSCGTNSKACLEPAICEKMNTVCDIQQLYVNTRTKWCLLFNV